MAPSFCSTSGGRPTDYLSAKALAEGRHLRRGLPAGKPRRHPARGLDQCFTQQPLPAHYVLDLWWERVAKPRMGGEVYLLRYLDDFVVCFPLERHKPLGEQVQRINQIPQGHYADYGMGGNFGSLRRIYRFAERYWRKMLSSLSQRGNINWETFQKIKQSFSLRFPRRYIPFARMSSLAIL